MNETTRRRVFVPLVMPLTILGAILLFSGSLSRILLAVDESVSVLVAVLAAAYVLGMAFVIERHPDITARVLTVGMVLAMVGLVGAGALAQSVGIREIHHEEEGAAEGEDGAAAGVEIPEGALVFGADSGLAYTSAPSSGTAGEVTIALDNEGSLEHNVAIEGVNGDAPIVSAISEVALGTVQLDPGTYTYFCTIAGHRAAGMEGELTLS